MFKRGTLADERIDGTEEADELHGSGGNDGLFGYGGVDNLYGDEGQDWLDGGEGGDGMDGGLGWDTYVVDSLFDIVRDTGQPSEQNTVRVQVDFYELTAVNPNIQVVVLVEGSAARSFYANSYNTTINGNSYDNAVYGYTARDFVYGWAGNDSLLGGQGNDELHGEGPHHITGIISNDSLDGGPGDDWMVGGPGDDSYTIDSAGDSTSEYPNEGTDTVFSYISWELEYQVENLVLYGSTDLTGIGNGIANTINGSLGNNALYGGPANDQLYGHAGNDQLDGEEGSDLLEGGLGNDTYYVDTDFDRVRDPGTDGDFDRVFTSATFRLHQTLAFIEELRTTNKAGTTAIDLFGSDSANLLEGNAGVNILDGRGGADVMSGLGGNDSYFVNHAGDRIIEGIGGGTDTVSASANYSLGAGVRVEIMQTLGAATTTTMTLTGNEFVNVMIGNAGVNALNGGGGADLMRGLAGTDIYIVDNAGDVVDESAAGSNGIDLVQSAISFSFSDATHTRGALENLTLIGTAAINGTGNTLANGLTGNAAVNTLNGFTGADYLRGLGGNDTYIVDNAGDVVDEAAAGSSGIDVVQSSVTFNLSDAIHAKGMIDHVTLIGGVAINATGNGLNNTLTGNGTANILTGRAGSDTLTGAAGNDQFRFDTALGASNIDTITDFDVDGAGADSFDTIQLENSIFTQLTTLGDLAASRFLKVTSNADADNGRTITYVSSTGGLFYDTNGATAGGATMFAVLDTGLALTNLDFFVT